MTRIKELEARIRSLESCVVAFSGGVDSSLVAALAVRALGEREQLAQRLLGVVGTRAEHLETVAAPPDLDIEAGLEQPQVLIERPAKVGKACIVRR